MNEEKQISIDKQIRQNYRKNFVSKSSLVAVLTLFIIACLALAYFVPITLLITIPLIIIPLLTGFIAENITANTKPSSIGRMMMGFRLYYSRQFFGIYRILESIIKTIIVYLICSSVLSIILHFAIGMNDPTYASLVNEIIRDRNIEDLNRNLQELLGNPTFVLIENITEIASIGLGSYMMVHHVLTHSIKVFYNLLGRNVFLAPGVNFIHRRAFSRFRRFFYKDYYSSFWYMILIYIVFYVGGALLGLLLLNRTGNESAIIGLFAATIGSVFFLPIVFDTIQVIFSIYSVYYIQAIMHNASTLKSIYGSKTTFSDEEIAMVDASVQELEHAIKSVKKDDKE